jgi:hypothetical protein
MISLAAPGGVPGAGAGAGAAAQAGAPGRFGGRGAVADEVPPAGAFSLTLLGMSHGNVEKSPWLISILTCTWELLPATSFGKVQVMSCEALFVQVQGAVIGFGTVSRWPDVRVVESVKTTGLTSVAPLLVTVIV